MLESRRNRGFSNVCPLSRSHVPSDFVMLRLLSTMASVAARQTLDPGIGQEFLQEDVPVLEVELAVLLRQNLGLDARMSSGVVVLSHLVIVLACRVSSPKKQHGSGTFAAIPRIATHREQSSPDSRPRNSNQLK